MITTEEMLKKLNELYDKEEKVYEAIEKLLLELDQLKEDKEMLQNMFMYSSNKMSRDKENGKGI